MKLHEITEKLTKAQKRELIADFKEWSGGYTPNEAEDRIDDYIEGSLSTELPEKAAREYLENYISTDLSAMVDDEDGEGSKAIKAKLDARNKD